MMVATLTYIFFFLSASVKGIHPRIRAEPSNEPIDLEFCPDFNTNYKCGLETYTGNEVYLAVQHAVNLQIVDATRGGEF
ncbi:guanyl-specific ribonuclease F1 [Pyrenophora teres f. maculata]|nr:guanyl-specific ribonuclease F1 [Pyrenophora teres f. maculata]